MQPELPEADVALAAALLKNANDGEASEPALAGENGERSLWWKNRRG
jgi:hypothetical protein